MGHSLGSQVILSTVEYLSKKKQNKGIIESVYFFRASITEDTPSSKKYGKILQNIVNKKIINHYAPTDEVLNWMRLAARRFRLRQKPDGMLQKMARFQ